MSYRMSAHNRMNGALEGAAKAVITARVAK
jgi:hypothetical protein